MKSPREAKTRLAPVLSEDERARLVAHMLDGVLTALGGSERLAGVLVITPDPEIAEQAVRHGASVLEESRSGLNTAIRQACEHLRRRDAGAMLVIPGDLPLLSTDSIDRLIAEAPATPRSVVVAPDASRIGTNALLCSPPGLVDPAFGAPSFEQHCRRARDAGAELAVVTLPEIALDLDEPADVGAILRLARGVGPHRAAACRTIRFLEELDVARRFASRDGGSCFECPDPESPDPECQNLQSPVRDP